MEDGHPDPYLYPLGHRHHAGLGELHGLTREAGLYAPMPPPRALDHALEYHRWLAGRNGGMIFRGVLLSPRLCFPKNQARIAIFTLQIVLRIYKRAFYYGKNPRKGHCHTEKNATFAGGKQKVKRISSTNIPI